MGNLSYVVGRKRIAGGVIVYNDKRPRWIFHSGQQRMRHIHLCRLTTSDTYDGVGFPVIHSNVLCSRCTTSRSHIGGCKI